jgi:ferredoxin--NADP+ reductase
MHRILGKERLAPDIVRFSIEAPHIAKKRRPGQFVIVRLREGGERIPLTIVDADVRAGSVDVVVQGVGKTTCELNTRCVGETILDVAGPLGRPAQIDPGRHVCCVAGGIGAAVILPLAKAMREAGRRVTIIQGARTHDLVILERELRAVADRYHVTTDDGSFGHRGVVSDVLREVVANDPSIDRVVAAGPVAMMRAACQATRQARVPTLVSLNPIMLDGTGMCGGCRVTVGGVLKFACVDGPEFDGHQVDFDELSARLTAFVDQEQAANVSARVPTPE